VNVDGKEQIVRLGQNGDTIGYRALLSKDKYSATAITMEDSKICTIPSQFFFKIIEENIKVAMSYTSLLAKELREAQTKMAELALKPVRERIAEALIVLKETFGYDQDGQTINVNISREEIAQLAGTATETSIRLLSELKKSHIIDFDKKRIKILEPKKLLVEANLWD
jgi:CRP/FNR family transcriptional regulator